MKQLLMHPGNVYDVTVDRSEMHDLSKTHPEKVRSLSAAWDQWADENQVTPLPRDLGVKYLKPD